MSARLKRFTVEGAGEFPFDMLRYDQCWPETNRDVLAMTMGPEYDGYLEPRQVRLETGWSAGHGSSPTAARWRSFGWKVIP